jgi:hypothetical protein
MPGPRDHVAEQEQSPDPARPREQDHPREAQAQSADLQGRLERLPVGHPSSPYRGDGSRKPPPPDRTQYELPLPDELPLDTDQPDPRLPTGDAPRVDPDGTWHWKGRDLAPEESRIGDEAATKCREAEGRDADGNYGDHGLTPAMRRIEAQLDHGHLAKDTEQHALKEPDRFKEKLAKLIVRYPGESPEELAAEIHDGVRYTFVSSTEHYVENFWDTSAKLQDSGFELLVRTNTWGDEQYKGINTRWHDSDSGLPFEVQVHSYESLSTKEQTHEAYEKMNDTRTPVEEVESLREHQREVSAQVPLPQGWESIPDYRKENS